METERERRTEESRTGRMKGKIQIKSWEEGKQQIEENEMQGRKLIDWDVWVGLERNW